jgi:hypothetical protein
MNLIRTDIGAGAILSSFLQFGDGETSNESRLEVDPLP